MTYAQDILYCLYNINLLKTMKPASLEEALIKLSNLNNPYIDIITTEELEILIIRGLNRKQIIEYGKELKIMEDEKNYTYQFALYH